MHRLAGYLLLKIVNLIIFFSSVLLLNGQPDYSGWPLYFLQLFFNISIFLVISNSCQIKPDRDDFTCYLYLRQNQAWDAARVQDF
ncbi:MAG: hypothetical protein DRH32_04860, partial [Deltaproteobacteria bacterium]